MPDCLLFMLFLWDGADRLAEEDVLRVFILKVFEKSIQRNAPLVPCRSRIAFFLFQSVKEILHQLPVKVLDLHLFPFQMALAFAVGQEH